VAQVRLLKKGNVMDKNKIARDNHAFYYVVVGQVLCSDEFTLKIIGGIDESVLYGIEDDTRDTCTGYIEVDTSDIVDNSVQDTFVDDLRNDLLGKVALKIPQSIQGELNTDVVIAYHKWVFTFNITLYERDGTHRFELVEDPTPLPNKEKLGRIVRMTVSVKE
jgi:hypothetical protein